MKNLSNLLTKPKCTESCCLFIKFPCHKNFIVCNNPASDHYKHVLSKLHPICDDNKTMTEIVGKL